MNITPPRNGLAIALARFAIVVSVLIAPGCTDSVAPDHGSQSHAEKLIAGLLVSGPLFAPSVVLAAGAGPAADSELVYVSMAPGTLEDGDSVQVARARTNAVRVSEPMGGGGFDPLSIYAAESDSLEVAVFERGVKTIAFARVPAFRQPSVIRTTPARGRTDVPLNQSIIIVFSQPLDGTTVNSTTVQLQTGGASVPAVVSVLPDQPWVVRLSPTAPLLPNTAYSIRVAGTITDADGRVLAAPVSADFATGTGTLTVASIVVVAYSPYRPAGEPLAQATPGSSVTLSSILLSAAGDTLDASSVAPLEWTSNDSLVIRISNDGIAHAISVGQATVSACLASICGHATVIVSGPTSGIQPVDLGELGGGSSLIFAMSGDYTVGNSRVPRDLSGNVNHHAVQWSTAGIAEDLGTLPGNRESYAEMVSDGGVIVGHGEWRVVGNFGIADWWTWTRASGMKPIVVPDQTHQMWTPGAINSAGDIAFSTFDENAIGLTSPVGSPIVSVSPVTHYYIAGMNRHRQVAIGVLVQPTPERKLAGDGDWSSCATYALVWDIDAARVISTLTPQDPDTGAGTSICPSAINDDGVVTGGINQFDPGRAFRWSASGGFTFLDKGLGESAGQAINNLGDIALVVVNVIHAGQDSLFEQTAAVWTSDDRVIALGTLGGSVSSAQAISDSRMVGGYSQVGSVSGPQHAALWDIRSAAGVSAHSVAETSTGRLARTATTAVVGARTGRAAQPPRHLRARRLQ